MFSLASLDPPLRVKVKTANGDVECIAVAVGISKGEQEFDSLHDLNNRTALLAIPIPYETGKQAMEWVALGAVNWAAPLIGD